MQPHYRKSALLKDSSETESSETDQEKNPGNPYTIHKNKYYQNWLWNFEVC